MRDQFKAFFAAIGHPLPHSQYVKFPTPIPITVTGSVFFDVDHTPGDVHSGSIVPDTVWEIHPISNLVFDPNGGQ